MNYRIRFHPAVSSDLDDITGWLLDHASPLSVGRRLAEIEATIESLASLPHKGSIREAIAPGLRAIPAGRKAVIAFAVDDARREVLILAVTYAGADWIARSKLRGSRNA